jgi:DNA-directed RNA polymerase specialized sigma24 family protein
MLSQTELLAIFDADAQRAEEKYQELYRRLVRYFEWNQSEEPADLAQEALKRGFAKLHQGQKITIGDPAGYFFGIARNLIRESWKVRPQEQLEDQEFPETPSSFQDLNSSEQKIFLKECLEHLSNEELEMLLAYVDGDGEEWGYKAGLTPIALRIRIHRLRKRLEERLGKSRKPKKA